VKNAPSDAEDLRPVLGASLLIAKIQRPDRDAALIRGAAYASLTIVVRHTYKLLRDFPAKDNAEIVRVLDLAIRALTDVRDALKEGT